MDMMKIAVASTNQAKLDAVEQTLEELDMKMEIIAVKTDSGVSEQPFSIAETKQGAVNRAKEAIGSGADMAIGLEGGVYELDGTLYLCNWGALTTVDGLLFTAAGAQIPLPEKVAEQLREGAELGPVMDKYANETGIRYHKGAIGILTANLVKRGEMFGHVVKLLIGQYLLRSG